MRNANKILWRNSFSLSQLRRLMNGEYVCAMYFTMRGFVRERAVCCDGDEKCACVRVCEFRHASLFHYPFVCVYLYNVHISIVFQLFSNRNSSHIYIFHLILFYCFSCFSTGDPIIFQLFDTKWYVFVGLGYVLDIQSRPCFNSSKQFRLNIFEANGSGEYKRTRRRQQHRNEHIYWYHDYVTTRYAKYEESYRWLVGS